jgi:dTDP-4-dehydrorhamnose 3,5-epimerase
MKINNTRIQGVVEIIREPIIDKRGLFERVYCDESLNDYVSSNKIMQINHSISVKKGSIRGMHMQLGEYAETKIISCLAGTVFDVALDLRKNSTTFLEWVSITLSPEAHNSILIPRGVAHGFQTLAENSELLYFHTANYSPNHEFGVSYQEPKAQISWPLTPTEISERDKSFIFLNKDFLGYDL